MKTKEQLAFNPELVKAIKEAITRLDNCEAIDGELADILGECHNVSGELSDAIERAKKRVKLSGRETVEGIRWRVSVTEATRQTVNNSQVASFLQSVGRAIDEFKTQNTSRTVRFKSLY